MDFAEIRVGEEYWLCRPTEISMEGYYDKYRPERVKITSLSLEYPVGGYEDVMGSFEDSTSPKSRPICSKFLFHDLEAGWDYIRTSLLETRAELIRLHEGTLQSIDEDLQDWVGKL